MDPFTLIFLIFFLIGAIRLILPLLIEGSAAAARFLLACVVASAILLADLSWKGAKWLWINGIPAAQYLYFLLLEVLQSLRSADSEEDEQPAPRPASGTLTVEAARKLLGLPPTFTKDEFTAAFRRAISKVHPDRGGTAKDAQAVYAARTIIKTHFGW